VFEVMGWRSRTCHSNSRVRTCEEKLGICGENDLDQTICCKCHDVILKGRKKEEVEVEIRELRNTNGKRYVEVEVSKNHRIVSRKLSTAMS